MNKLILKAVAIFVSSFMMIGCGSGDNAGTTNVIPLYNVSGTVVDGPISGAIVNIYGVDENSTILYGTTTTDEFGSFSVMGIKNLPAVYRVVITDGIDTGVDAKADENDEELGFEMSAIVEREEDNETGQSMANVSPATTIVDKIVEDGVMPLEDAQKTVAKSFGLDEDTVLAKLDNNKNSLGNKVGNLIGFLTKISPIENKNIVIEAIVNLVKNKEVNVSVSDTGIDLSKLDLMDLMTEVNKTAIADNIPIEDNISPDDISKIGKTSDIIKEKLANLLDTIKTADSISADDGRKAVSFKIALESLLSEIHEQSADEIDVDELNLFVKNTQETIKALLDDSDTNETRTDENIAFVLELIKANLSEDLADVKKFVIKASNDYKIIIKKIDGNIKIKIKSSVKNIVKNIYKNVDINKSETIVDALDDATLEEISDTADDIDSVVETGEMPTEEATELTNELEDTVADQIAGIIETGEMPTTESIKSVTDESVNNPILVEAIKTRVKIKVKIKIKAKKEVLSDDDNSELIASTKVIKTIKINVKIKSFTREHADSCDSYQTHIKDTIKSSTKIKITIKAFDIERFDLNGTEYLTTELMDILDQLIGTDIDLLSSIYKIKIKIKTDFLKVDISSQTTLDDILGNIDDYKEEVVPEVRVLSLPQPTLPDMPEEFATPIEVKI